VAISLRYRPSSAPSSCCARSSNTPTSGSPRCSARARPVGEREPRFETSREQRDRLASRFFEAFEDGNLEALEAMLADDVTLRGDGGGKVPALARPLHGRVRVARTLRNFSRAAERFGYAELRPVEINGEAGGLALDEDGKLITVIVLVIAGGQIRSLNAVANPDKLHHLGPVGDPAERFGGARR
jgi:RNA polymerase sigma-70 factor (ECF subfamily)